MGLQNKSEMIRQAIGAHGAWKLKLRTAAKTGRADFSPETIACDDQCEFGKWLGQIAPNAAGDPHFARVQDLHSRFHLAAGHVASLIKSGDLDAARGELADGSAFARGSAQLTDALNDWKRSS